MRLVDVVLAFPFLIFAVGMAAILGPSLRNVIIALGVSQIPADHPGHPGRGARRSARWTTSSAAVADGAGDGRIMFRYVLPNATSALIVQATVAIPGGDHRRGDAVLPRPRRPAADPVLGRDAHRRAAVPRPGAVAGVWPGVMIALPRSGSTCSATACATSLDPRSSR